MILSGTEVMYNQDTVFLTGYHKINDTDKIKRGLKVLSFPLKIYICSAWIYAVLRSCTVYVDDGSFCNRHSDFSYSVKTNIVKCLETCFRIFFAMLPDSVTNETTLKKWYGV